MQNDRCLKIDGVKLNSFAYSSSESFELWLDSGAENFGAWIAGFLFGDAECVLAFNDLVDPTMSRIFKSTKKWLCKRSE